MVTITYRPDSKSSLDVELLSVYNSIVDNVRKENPCVVLPVVFGVTVEDYDSRRRFCKADIAVNVDTKKYDDLGVSDKNSIHDVALSVDVSVFRAYESMRLSDSGDLNILDDVWYDLIGKHIIGEDWSVSYKQPEM